jgi:hypothetical protein
MGQHAGALTGDEGRCEQAVPDDSGGEGGMNGRAMLCKNKKIFLLRELDSRRKILDIEHIQWNSIYSKQ